MSVRPFTWLALSFFGYYCAYGVFMPFFPVWLKSQHYGEELIGMVLASAYVFRFVGGLFFSGLIKRASQLINSLRLLALASALIMAGLSFAAESFWLLFGAIGLFAMVNSAGMPITDSLASTWQRQIQLDYGKARLIGSMAFVVGVTLFGNVIGFFGEQNIVWILTALLLVYSMMQCVTPTIPPQDEPSEQATAEVRYWDLLKNNTTLRVLIASSLIQGSHAAYYVYSVLYWTSLGIPVSQTSLLWGVAVVAEILLFFFSRRLLQNWKVTTIFYLATFACIVRWLGLATANTIWLIAILQLLHSLTYAVAHYGMVRYITTQPQAHISKLQALYNGFSNSAMVAILTALSGVIYPYSPAFTFILMAIVVAPAFVVTPRKVDAFLLKQG
ncbi:MFS transporter [Aggregatibacter aphrophilus NJ8700]|jgi:probable 3-phenylpropionic acid transporter|uniref:3-phenylpropionate MFS transporter n=1 Tax=Aggregatibacter aphrophilus TaxID=732 RepID=A0AAP7GYC7_AGGAP|nr:3-phenylpropionate MFS transporter [Aggregatibacter aphrophilus]ACS96573.1 probable 3-phenylpropionic acid transporter [Aggregatibacter aphrophilus NJ8700]AKS63980.1 MFS transporter [Aggregatibacter aphrophilus NJ8700]AKU63190.1 MFS transporter [Aggregatibacter aphrophilus]EHB90200.1 3-phenylpropionic acid transporter [Aggregatibacter aphrophilus F0387]OBY54019.1 3-phenylpropionic acid transporter [Aggregatibacter aphrophilus]